MMQNSEEKASESDGEAGQQKKLIKQTENKRITN